MYNWIEISLFARKLTRRIKTVMRNVTVRRLIFPVTGIAALVCITFMNSLESTPKKTRYKVSSFAKERISEVYIPENYTGIPCDYTLDLTKTEILQKVNSYEFPGIEEYINELFQDTDEKHIPRDPVFVTGLSSNHFKEGVAMLYNFSRVLNKDKRQELIVYDLGLTVEQFKLVEIECSCQVRSFPFDDFPDHVRILKGYSWKPLIIQLVSKRNPFVIWLDASIRFTTSNIEEMLQSARNYGVLAIGGVFKLAYQTSIETFRFLNEPPCLYSEMSEVQTGVTMMYQTPFVRKYIMIPWVSCALVRGCMVPVEDVYGIQNCHGDRHYFHCHRFDQSILGILINRLFHRTFTNHYISLGKYFVICWDCKVKGAS